MKLLKIILWTILAFGQFQSYAQKNGFDYILVLFAQDYTGDTQYQILNLDHSLYAEVKSIDGNEPSCSKIKDKISVYDDTYYLFHFESKPNKTYNFYEVKIGNEIKLIRKDNTIKLYSMEEYILKYYCVASKTNPLRIAPSETAPLIKINYKDVSFICLEIKGDWVKVQCNIECEGCPNRKKITGWIRWRKNKIKILEQYYVC